MFLTNCKYPNKNTWYLYVWLYGVGLTKELGDHTPTVTSTPPLGLPDVGCLWNKKVPSNEEVFGIFGTG